MKTAPDDEESPEGDKTSARKGATAGKRGRPKNASLPHKKPRLGGAPQEGVPALNNIMLTDLNHKVDTLMKKVDLLTRQVKNLADQVQKLKN